MKKGKRKRNPNGREKHSNKQQARPLIHELGNLGKLVIYFIVWIKA